MYPGLCISPCWIGTINDFQIVTCLCLPEIHFPHSLLKIKIFLMNIPCSLQIIAFTAFTCTL